MRIRLGLALRKAHPQQTQLPSRESMTGPKETNRERAKDHGGSNKEDPPHKYKTKNDGPAKQSLVPEMIQCGKYVHSHRLLSILPILPFWRA